MIIAIDFDGTIVADHYPNIGPLRPGAREAINGLAADGHYLILNTCRSGKKLLDALNFCCENGIFFGRINDNHPDLTAEHGSTRKVFADVYVDDRNLGGFPGWEEVRRLINTKTVE